MLFGAPGVGKGTYSKLMDKEYDFKTFSMGDYFRQLTKEESTDPFIVNIKKILREGQLVDDKLVVDIIKKIRTEPQFSKHMGLILDGVPRTLPQAKMMKESGIKIDLIINFFNREEILLQKLMSRRVCPCCGKNYNIADINTADGYQMKPLLPKKKVDECDDCPGNVKLVIREDDSEKVIRDRMKIYESKTQPILEFYKSECTDETQVINFEAKKGVGDYPEVKRILKESLKI
jgi:adenylate kinase